MSELRTHAHASADREVVWAVLVDHAAASGWMSGVVHSRLVTPGQDDRNGVGAVRVFLTMAGPVRERVTTFEPPGHLAYEMAPDNPLVRDFRGVVRLREDAHGGGTDIDWVFRFEPRLRSTRPVVERIVKLNTGRFASDLAGAAAERAR